MELRAEREPTRAILATGHTLIVKSHIQTLLWAATVATTTWGWTTPTEETRIARPPTATSSCVTSRQAGCPRATTRIGLSFSPPTSTGRFSLYIFPAAQQIVPVG